MSENKSDHIQIREMRQSDSPQSFHDFSKVQIVYLSFSCFSPPLRRSKLGSKRLFTAYLHKVQIIYESINCYHEEGSCVGRGSDDFLSLWYQFPNKIRLLPKNLIQRPKRWKIIIPQCMLLLSLRQPIESLSTTCYDLQYVSTVCHSSWWSSTPSTKDLMGRQIGRLSIGLCPVQGKFSPLQEGVFSLLMPPCIETHENGSDFLPWKERQLTRQGITFPYFYRAGSAMDLFGFWRTAKEFIVFAFC